MTIRTNPVVTTKCMLNGPSYVNAVAILARRSARVVPMRRLAPAMPDERFAVQTCEVLDLAQYPFITR